MMGYVGVQERQGDHDSAGLATIGKRRASRCSLQLITIKSTDSCPPMDGGCKLIARHYKKRLPLRFSIGEEQQISPPQIARENLLGYT